MNSRNDKAKKRKVGAILSAALVLAVALIYLAIILWANAEDPAPVGILIFIIATCAVIPIGVAIALKQRLDELKKGEIDEADKY